MVALQGMSLCALQRHVMNTGVQRTLVWIKVWDPSCLNAVVSAVSHLCCAVMSFWVPQTRQKSMCALQSSVHSGQAGPAALNNSNTCFGHIHNHNRSSWEQGHFNPLCMSEKFKRKKGSSDSAQVASSQGKRGHNVENPSSGLAPSFVIPPKWEVLVCWVMWGLEHCSRSSLFSFISRWCRWDVSQPNERETVFFDSLMGIKHSHKVMEKSGEDSLK